jgi:tRNA A-37 threonylcarbamoyl transferase component Bud32
MCAADGWYDHLVRVHFPEYVWICECKENKDTDMHKLWPRLDNFLKHLVDKHEFLRSPAADASIRSLGLKVMDCYHQICGFCEAPLRNRQESLEHIEDHLDNGKQLRDWMHHCSSDHDLRSHIQEDWRKHMYISRVYQHGHNDDEEDRSDGFDASSNGRQHGHEIDKDPNASEKGASSSSRNFGSSQPHGNIPFDGEINLACEGSTPPPSFDLDADMLPFTWIRELGHGGYGIVDEVLSSSSKQTYARKTIRPRQTPHRTASHIAQLKNELQILRKLNHPHLIKLVGFYTDQTSFYVIMSPVADINLADYMRKPMSTTSLEQKILLMRWMSCLASAVGYLHDEKIRHRDIKPQNILVKGKNVYLTDLGNAKLFFDQNDISAEKMVTTPMYCAPETMSRGQQNCSADIFALGCVFIEMSNGYFGHSVLELDNFRLECGNRPYYLTATDTQGYLKRLVESHRDGLTSELILLFTLIGNMLEIQPSLRPKARDLQYLFPDRWRCWWSRTGLERLKDGTESNNLALLTPSQSPGLRPQP